MSIKQQPPSDDLPNGVSRFLLSVRDLTMSEDDDVSLIMTAPSDLAYTQTTPHDNLRLASFIALACSAQSLYTDPGEIDCCCLVSNIGHLAHWRPNDRYTIMKVYALDGLASCQIKWPTSPSFDDLANLARAELKRTALSKIAQCPPTPARPPAPKF